MGRPMRRGLPIPGSTGRGAGLGNELIVWGKAYVASQALDLRLLRPAFGLNARGYGSYFRTSSLDWLAHRAPKTTLPCETFTEADFQVRSPLSFADAVVDFGRERALAKWPFYAFCLEGMLGGISAIETAKTYLLNQLLSTSGTLENIFKLRQRIPQDRVCVGFHIRRGDFSESTRDHGERWPFNMAIPMEWYVSVALELKRKLGDAVTFIVVSDASPETLEPFGSKIPCLFTDHLRQRDVSDLISLSMCDLVVCSVSTFSIWSAFFSEGRYVWFSPNLTVQEGLASIWGDEPAQQLPNGPTSVARRSVEAELLTSQMSRRRGVPCDWTGRLPDELGEWLSVRAMLLRRQTDLIRYGVVRVDQRGQHA